MSDYFGRAEKLARTCAASEADTTTLVVNGLAAVTYALLAIAKAIREK
jgi:hypothetical protein